MSNQVLKYNKPSVKQQERSISESILLLLPIILVAVFLPLVVKMHTYDPKLSQYDWFSTQNTYFDFFLYYKQWFFVTLLVLMVLCLVGRAFFIKEKLRYNRILLPLFLYATLAFLSTIFSKHKYSGFYGGLEQFENVFCIIGYVFVVYYLFMIVKTEEELQLMIRMVAIGALLVGIIGSFQAFGMDFFNTPFGKSVIAERGIDPQSLSIVFGEGRVYSTLYNPNYVGVYTSIMITLFTTLLLFNKNIANFILYGGVVVTSAISMFGSQSKSGIISIVIAFLIIVVMLRRIIVKQIKLFIPLAILLVGSFIIINTINDNAYLKAIYSAFITSENKEISLNSIETTTENVQVTYKGNTLFVSEDSNGEIIIKDSTTNVVPYNFIDQQEGASLLEILDSRFNDILIANYTDADFDFSIYINDEYWSFSKTVVPNTYTYYNRYGNFSPIKTPESSIFTGHEDFASGRGYIWSRTIPLLKHYILLGSGADTFINSFPQYDYVGFYNNGYTGTIISKPHNLYLQIGVQSGVLSLIMFLTYFILYSVQSFKLYYKNNFITVSSRIGIAVFVSIISYLISGLSNDSSISVAPVFWVIAGIGFVCNFFESKNGYKSNI